MKNNTLIINLLHKSYCILNINSSFDKDVLIVCKTEIEFKEMYDYLEYLYDEDGNILDVTMYYTKNSTIVSKLIIP